MANPPDIEETLSRLLAELRRLPHSVEALEQLGILVTLLERRTRYINYRAGLIVTICCMIGLIISNGLAQGWSASIELGRVVTTILVLLVMLGIVAVLDFRLQRKPIPDEDLLSASLKAALKHAQERRDL